MQFEFAQTMKIAIFALIWNLHDQFFCLTNDLLVDEHLHHLSKHELLLASKSSVLCHHAHVCKLFYFAGKKGFQEVKAQ